MLKPGEEEETVRLHQWVYGLCAGCTVQESLIEGSVGWWKVVFSFWWNRSCREAPALQWPWQWIGLDQKKLCCSSLFFPEVWPQFTEGPHAKYSFYCDLPWHDLGKPFPEPHVFWLIEFLRCVSPAAVDSLLTASAHGNTEKFSLPARLDTQFHCRVSESTVCNSAVSLHSETLNSSFPFSPNQSLHFQMSSLSI